MERKKTAHDGGTKMMKSQMYFNTKGERLEVRKRKASDYENCEWIYFMDQTIFLVRHGRVIGMILMDEEAPFSNKIPSLDFGRVRT